MGLKLTIEDFINKSCEMWGNKYDYTLTNYKNARTKVIITCLLDGHGIFEQLPFDHYSGKEGCKKCHSIKLGILLRGLCIIDLTGCKFGDLMVLYRDNQSDKKYPLWVCKCHCGQIIKVRGSYLSGGQTSRCRLCAHKQTENNVIGVIPQSYWSQTQKGANRRNIDFTISPEYAWELYKKQDGKCAYTGLRISFRDNGRNIKHTASLDRISSNKPYEIDNIQWVHKDINRMKQNLDEAIFLYYCTLIHKKSTLDVDMT